MSTKILTSSSGSTKTSENSTSNHGLNSVERQSFKKIYPNLDRICNASLIRELFKVSKVDSLSLIENHQQINLLFKSLEEKVEQLNHRVVDELKKFLANPGIQDQLEELRKNQKVHKEHNKVIQEKLRALELCKEMFIEMERVQGHQMDKANISLQDVEQMLVRSSGHFQEKYSSYLEQKEIKEAEQKLKALAEDHKLVLLTTVGGKDEKDKMVIPTEISPDQIVFDQETGYLVIKVDNRLHR